jgi:hypothetical protein
MHKIDYRKHIDWWIEHKWIHLILQWWIIIIMIKIIIFDHKKDNKDKY